MQLVLVSLLCEQAEVRQEDISPVLMLQCSAPLLINHCMWGFSSGLIWRESHRAACWWVQMVLAGLILLLRLSEPRCAQVVGGAVPADQVAGLHHQRVSVE